MKQNLIYFIEMHNMTNKNLTFLPLAQQQN